MNPRLSFFGFSKDIEAIASAGYDLIEMQMSEVMGMEDEAVELTRQNLQAVHIACEVLDNPVPLQEVVADESFDLGFYREYLRKGAERATQLGVKKYIFGNGKTRSLPLEGEIKAAKEKNLEFLRMLADIAGEKGITILIEPLAPKVSNVVQSIPEALDYINEIGRPNLGTFLDYRWFVDRGHPLSMIEEYGKQIQHLHLDNPLSPFPARVIPRMDDGVDYSPLFEALRRIDYQGIISIEANTFRDFRQDLQDTMEFFKAQGIGRQR